MFYYVIIVVCSRSSCETAFGWWVILGKYVLSVLTTRPRPSVENGLALTMWYHTPSTTVSQCRAWTILHWAAYTFHWRINWSALFTLYLASSSRWAWYFNTYFTQIITKSQKSITLLGSAMVELYIIASYPWFITQPSPLTFAVLMPTQPPLKIPSSWKPTSATMTPWGSGNLFCT